MFPSSLLILSSRECGLLDLPLRASNDHHNNAPFKLACNLSQRGGLVGPQLRASNEALPRARVPRARRAHEPAPSHPLRRILLSRLFFCKPSIEDRQDQQRECRRGEEAADDDGCKRPLDFGPDPLREG